MARALRPRGQWRDNEMQPRWWMSRDLHTAMDLPKAVVSRGRRGLRAALSAAILVPMLATASLAQGAAPKAPAGASADSQANAVLQQRVDQLEEQLVDMQVVVGTLESLARGGTAAAAPASSGSDYGGPDPRVDALETQVRALTAQIEQLTAQVRSMSETGVRHGDAGQQPAAGDAQFAAAPPATETTHFGSTTVTAGTGDPIGGMIEGNAPDAAAAAAPAAQMAAAPPAFMPPPAPAGDGGNPKQLYETAYGYLMQRDYGSAQSAFEDFLNRYPNDSLAGNAQYWLGEAHFVRGEYKAAAGAFLKGYQNYAGNARAADSLLKLAMSLDRLGQKDAACSSFSELTTRFPDAPDNVKMRAKSERQRIGCTS